MPHSSFPDLPTIIYSTRASGGPQHDLHLQAYPSIHFQPQRHLPSCDLHPKYDSSIRRAWNATPNCVKKPDLDLYADLFILDNDHPLRIAMSHVGAGLDYCEQISVRDTGSRSKGIYPTCINLPAPHFHPFFNLDGSPSSTSVTSTDVSAPPPLSSKCMPGVLDLQPAVKYYRHMLRTGNDLSICVHSILGFGCQDAASGPVMARVAHILTERSTNDLRDRIRSEAVSMFTVYWHLV